MALKERGHLTSNMERFYRVGASLMSLQCTRLHIGQSGGKVLAMRRRYSASRQEYRACALPQSRSSQMSGKDRSWRGGDPQGLTPKGASVSCSHQGSHDTRDFKALESNCCSLSGQGFYFLVRKPCLYATFFFSCSTHILLRESLVIVLLVITCLGQFDIHHCFSESEKQEMGGMGRVLR